MRAKTSAILLAILICASDLLAQNAALLQKAGTAFTSAEAAEAALKDRPSSGRARADYLNVINAYQRVYVITPHTGYADNALIAMARLYEEIKDVAAATRTLKFLVREYPDTPFLEAANRDITRLNNPVQETAARNTVVPEVTVKNTGTPAAINNVSYRETPDSLRVVIDVSGDVTFKQGQAKSPDRVFLDIFPAHLSRSLIGKEWPVQSGIVQKIRVGQYDASTVRVVLDVAATQRVTSFSLEDPDRLVLDVTRPAGAATQTASVKPAVSLAAAAPARAAAKVTAVSAVAPPPAPVIKPVEAAVIPVVTPIVIPIEPKIVTAAKPTSDGNHSLIRSLGLKVSRVVIDAGHGGHDTGSIGPTGLTEKELVLDVGNRLKTLIETKLGAEVVMTRAEDAFVPLEARAAMANRDGADLFISIHANSSRTGSVRGVETFFLNLPNTKDAMETAARENAAAERSIHETEDIVKKIMLNDKVDESRELARHLQTAMAKRKDAGPNRGVKQAPFLVLIGADMPSVLAEISFISNPQEERLLKTAAYRQQIAEALLDGVRSYSETLSAVKTAESKKEEK